MRKWLRRVGIALALVIAAILGSVWYVRALPWRNSCGDAPSSAARSSANSAVATGQPLATDAARGVLAEGGNAVDAAIAAALMLAVAEPSNSGLGGGGFALVREPDSRRNVFLDFRERAPLGLDVAELQREARQHADVLRNGAAAVAVPAEWNGLQELHRRYGSLPLSRLARPAIEAARSGVAVGGDYTARCWERPSALRSDPEARAIFLNWLGLCPFPGWMLRQPQLADTLTALTRERDKVSWDALVGAKMVAFLRAKGSSISQRDLEAQRVVERPTVEGHFRGKRIVSIGPPSSGGIIVIALLQAYERLRQRLPRANPLLLWTEASRLAFYDRAREMGDTDFVQVPVERLISEEYATEQAARADAEGHVSLPLQVAPRQGPHTTHLTVVDKHGMAIAMTLTLNVQFGSGMVVPGTGVLLNNEMDDFYLAGPNSFGLIGNAQNAPAPGKRPLSSMSPTFVFDGDELVMALGSPGGSNIPTAVAWVIREVLEEGKSADAALRAPRIHHQWSPDRLQVEPRFDRSKLPAELAAKADTPSFPLGRVEMVAREGGGLRGLSDCRDEGTGWSGRL